VDAGLTIEQLKRKVAKWAKLMQGNVRKGR
jgi:hypothetical protein